MLKAERFCNILLPLVKFSDIIFALFIIWGDVMKTDKVKSLIISSLFLALGIVLPLFTFQIKEIGDSLLPMHIPVLLCGFLCGGIYGAAVGFMLPFFRSLLFGMPPIYPNAVWMALELATYGLVVGLLYSKAKSKNITSIYLSLITAMLSGRVVWGVVKTILLGLSGKAFTFIAFITGGILDALPGIILQLILIPFIVSIVNIKANKEGL